MTKPTRVVLSSILLSTLVGPSISLAQSVAGQVCDIMRDSNCGIPGVKVRLYDSTGKEVAASITDASGRYQLTLTNSPSHRLRFDKAGYQDRPTYRSVGKPTDQQPPVHLVRENGDEAYYRDVAALYAAQTDGLASSHAEAIAALPALDRAQVHEALRNEGATDRLAALGEVERRAQTEKKVQGVLQRNPDWAYVQVDALGDDGKYVLGGAVGTANSKKSAEQAALSVDGVKAVENKISIDKRL